MVTPCRRQSSVKSLRDEDHRADGLFKYPKPAGDCLQYKIYQRLIWRDLTHTGDEIDLSIRYGLIVTYLGAR